MTPVTPRPLRNFAWLFGLALLLATLVAHFLAAHRQGLDLDLLRAENRLLLQENRLLRQELEAERLQSAALTRLLQGTADRPPVPAPPPAGP